MKPRILWIAVLLALGLGLAAGWLWRRAQVPDLHERAQDAAQQVKAAAERATH